MEHFFNTLREQFVELYALEDKMLDHRFMWISARDYAVDMEFKDQWHFVNNSDDNRLKLSSFWSATTCVMDIGSSFVKCWEKPASLPRRDWFSLRKNPNFVLEGAPESYIEKVKRATKMIFGESKRCVPLVGTRFTAEEV